MLNQLIYGDIRSSSGSGSGGDDAPSYPGDVAPGGEGEDSIPSELLRSRTGKLIYADGCSIKLWTWWDFDQSSENLSPIAYINGENRCGGHSTSHIIDYLIKKSNFSGRGSTVTMYVNMVMASSGKSCKWNGGASCVHRLWGGSSSYSGASEKHRAEKSGTCGGGATFKVIIDNDKGDYTIT